MPAKPIRALDLFAGAGGWDIAAHQLGWHVDGIEIMPEAQATRAAAGLTTLETGPPGPDGALRSDVRDITPAPGAYDVVIASPPCQSFSMAGKGAGRKALDAVLTVIRSYPTPRPMTYTEAAALMGDDRTALVAEPLRIVLACRPAFTAWEQVPAALPVWEAAADVLRAHGYTVVTGVLNAEQYGVPQTRKRAVLVARCDDTPAALPTPTHSKFHSRDPARLDPGVKPWISMAEALGWGMDAHPSMTVTGGGPDAGGDEPFGNGARTSMRREMNTGHWILRNGHQPNTAIRSIDQPGPTMAFGHNAAQVVWAQRSNYSRGGGGTAAERGRTSRDLDQPSVTLTGKPPSWADTNSAPSSTAGALRISVREAAILQTFPPDHPFQGSKGKQYLQVGNAVPPLLADAILSAYQPTGAATMPEPNEDLAARMAAADAAHPPTRPEPPSPGGTAQPPADTITIDDAHNVFRKWLGDEYDLGALDTVLAAAAVEKLDGDPVWLLVVSGSGNAKTETVGALLGADATVTSTITSEGALLSASSTKEKAKDATGGLLRKMGNRGTLVIKDFTSILSMNRDLRTAVLAAIREIYDGRWERNVGTDGGRTLTWQGRLVVIGAVTTAYDQAHAVISSMGDRFALVRMDSTTGRTAAGRQALKNVGKEVAMRAELAKAAGQVLAGLKPHLATLAGDDMESLLGAADLVTLARTAVERDYRGDPIEAHAPEMPTRFAKMLGQVMRGALALGIEHDRALSIAMRVARDTIPPLRAAILRDIAEHPGAITKDVVKRIQRPHTTVDRALRELHLIGLVNLQDVAEGFGTLWHYELAPDVHPPLVKALLADGDLGSQECHQTSREDAQAAEAAALFDKAGLT